MTGRRSSLLLPATLLLFPAFAPPAWAHAFGQRYDLPLPLWLYTLGAGAAVALSFVVMAVFMRARDAEADARQFDVLTVTGCRWLRHPIVGFCIRVLSDTVFALLIIACFIGETNPFKNIAPTFVWVIWWVGLAFISALVGNLWDLVNPWSAAFGWAEVTARLRALCRPYPTWLGKWPAVVLFFLFAWMELISEAAEQPRVLGGLIIVYSVITWACMARYGREAWLRNGEIFSVTFGVLARFAPLAGSKGRLILRPPAVGLLTREPVEPSTVFFVLLLLTSVTFDGILETPLWQSVLHGVSESQLLRRPLLDLQSAGVNLLMLIKTMALLTLPLVFAATYLVVCWFMRRMGDARASLATIAGCFVLSLVPIAIAYHLSHYLSYLLIAGQNIIPLVSDPFGFGWDLFGTAGYRLDIGIVNAKMVWYVAVSAIVTGHVAAVYIAHIMALRVFHGHRAALLSQIPMLVLMVAYTMISLWILSQPIVA